MNNKRDREALYRAKLKRERRIERNLRNEYMQGRGPDGLELMKDGTWSVDCSRCEEPFEWPASASEYDPDQYHYCGGSERCIP